MTKALSKKNKVIKLKEVITRLIGVDAKILKDGTDLNELIKFEKKHGEGLFTDLLLGKLEANNIEEQSKKILAEKGGINLDTILSKDTGALSRRGDEYIYLYHLMNYYYKVQSFNKKNDEYLTLESDDEYFTLESDKKNDEYSTLESDKKNDKPFDKKLKKGEKKYKKTNRKSPKKVIRLGYRGIKAREANLELFMNKFADELKKEGINISLNDIESIVKSDRISRRINNMKNVKDYKLIFSEIKLKIIASNIKSLNSHDSKENEDEKKKEVADLTKSIINNKYSKNNTIDSKNNTIDSKAASKILFMFFETDVKFNYKRVELVIHKIAEQDRTIRKQLLCNNINSIFEEYQTEGSDHEIQNLTKKTIELIAKIISKSENPTNDIFKRAKSTFMLLINPEGPYQENVDEFLKNPIIFAKDAENEVQKLESKLKTADIDLKDDGIDNEKQKLVNDVVNYLKDKYKNTPLSHSKNYNTIIKNYGKEFVEANPKLTLLELQTKYTKNVIDEITKEKNKITKPDKDMGGKDMCSSVKNELESENNKPNTTTLLQYIKSAKNGQYIDKNNKEHGVNIYDLIPVTHDNCVN